MAVDKKHIITLQGKEFVQYTGLLELAHACGLRGVSTKLVQVPSEENGRVAICMAEVTMQDGRTFTGIGDASPANLKSGMAPHSIRMAETRAKARAFRDATNFGMAAVEELGPDMDDEPKPSRRTEPKSAAAPKPAATPKSDHGKAADALFATAGEITSHLKPTKPALTAAVRMWLKAKGRPESSGDITTDALQALTEIMRNDPQSLLVCVNAPAANVQAVA